ncbi:hypothetical protein RF11_09816 [Thelohanellus kitauei]|uniref:Uncharacterized protein n=1 Tax=Thelohanellus kitauei TaxID=669202 RepID=A0A0C2JUZ0_THEKT|nr:hypothetical protein RF11_09816 [Thelohanellus kitauei]
MQYIGKIQSNLYVYDVKDPKVFNCEVPKEEQINQISAYLEEHYTIVSSKGSVVLTLQAIGMLGISNILTKNVEKATSLLMKQLKLTQEKKIEAELTKAANNLGVLYHRNGDLARCYIALVTAGYLRSHETMEFITEIYNLAVVHHLLGYHSVASKFLTYCYRWYSCRVPLNHFRIVKILISILDIYIIEANFEESVNILTKLNEHIRKLIGMK